PTSSILHHNLDDTVSSSLPPTSTAVILKVPRIPSHQVQLMRSFSIRSRSALALVALNVVAIGVLAFFAYRASRDSLTAQAVATVRLVAESGGDALTRAPERQQDRLPAVLTSVESLCGERLGSG